MQIGSFEHIVLAAASAARLGKGGMLYDRWSQIAREFRNELALIDLSSNRRWTFRELAETSHAQSNDRSPVCFPKGASADFIFSLLAAWRRGAVVCPVEHDQAPPQLEASSSRGVHLKTTSASTGKARFVLFTPEQLAADAENIVRTMGLRPDWPNLAVISLAHSYGFSNLVLPLLLHGIPLILADSPLPETVRSAAAVSSKITLPAVPALWRAWLEADSIPNTIALGISAGAPLSVSLEREVFDRFGLKIHNFYGASECGGIAFDRENEPRVDASCVGAPLEGVTVRINEEGCLCVRGRAVAEGYWPEASETLRQGEYQSGDLARIEHGLIYLQGRRSDEINVAGRKVSPETVERALAGHPNVRDCLVFGVPSSDADRTELIVACVVVRTPIATGELKQHLLAKLPAWQVPREWWVVPSLQVNQRGKLARGLWRQRYLKWKENEAR